VHTHPVFQDYNGMKTEKPTRVAFAERDVRLLDRPAAGDESIEIFSIPWFKQFKTASSANTRLPSAR
jgi:hypothetical protein